MARLGQLLVQANLVTENNLARALGVQHFAGGRLGTLLLERGSVDEDGLGNVLAAQHNCEYVSWRVLGDIPAVTIAALPAKFAIKHGAIPYERGENYLKLALRDPGDLRILDELFFVTGRKVFAGVAPEVRIYQALERYYGERRTPRYVILADKLSREARASRGLGAPPPPPEFFPKVSRRQTRIPAPHEIWGEGAEPDLGASPLIESWKLPDQPSGGWAGTSSPGMTPEPLAGPETILWEELPQIPSLWVPETTALSQESAAAKETPSPPPIQAPPPPPPAAAPRVEPVAPTAREAPIEQPAAAAAREPGPPPPMPLPAAARPAVAEAQQAVPPPTRPSAPPAGEAEPKPPPIEPRPAPPAPASGPASAPAPAGAAPRPAGIGRLVPEPNDFSEVAQSTDRDSIATAALAALGRRFDRGAIFIARPDAVAAWGITGNVEIERFRSIEIPWTEPSVFLNVRYSRTFYLGPLPPLPRHTPIARALGGWPEECVVYPVLIRDRPVAFLYAEFSHDRGASPMDLAYLRELAGTTSSAFASAIRLKKREI